jgi:hypothetical protein
LDVVPGAAKRLDLQIDDHVFAAGDPVRIEAMYHSDAHDEATPKDAGVGDRKNARVSVESGNRLRPVVR